MNSDLLKYSSSFGAYAPKDLLYNITEKHAAGTKYVGGINYI